MRRAVSVMAVLCVGCPGGGGDDCGSIAPVARTQIDFKVQKHVGHCTGASECSLVRASLDCYTGCLVATSRAEESGLVNDLVTLSQQICGDSTCTINAG